MIYDRALNSLVLLCRVLSIGIMRDGWALRILRILVEDWQLTRRIVALENCTDGIRTWTVWDFSCFLRNGRIAEISAFMGNLIFQLAKCSHFNPIVFVGVQHSLVTDSCWQAKFIIWPEFHTITHNDIFIYVYVDVLHIMYYYYILN